MDDGVTTHKQVVKAMLAANLIAEEMVALSGWENERRKKYGRVDPLDELESLELEYQLIQKKQSKLSRANRERVIYIVEHMEDIPDEQKAS